MSTLGDRLREIRQSHELTLKEVSEQSGLSISFLSLIERNKVSISLDHLEKLARFYGIRLVTLFQDIQDNAPLITHHAQIEKYASRATKGRSASC
jgi:transcriptional regulator with XRE-family HTH domain